MCYLIYLLGKELAPHSPTATAMMCATTETKAQMTRTPKLQYEIYAEGIEGPGSAAEGTMSVGMSASVDDKRKGLKLGYKTTVDGSFEFYKEMDFKP
jgi:hypothetical protein